MEVQKVYFCFVWLWWSFCHCAFELLRLSNKLLFMAVLKAKWLLKATDLSSSFESKRHKCDIWRGCFCSFVWFAPGWFSVVRGMLRRNAAAEMNKMQQWCERWQQQDGAALQPVYGAAGCRWWTTSNHFDKDNTYLLFKSTITCNISLYLTMVRGGSSSFAALPALFCTRVWSCFLMSSGTAWARTL